MNSPTLPTFPDLADLDSLPRHERLERLESQRWSYGQLFTFALLAHVHVQLNTYLHPGADDALREWAASRGGVLEQDHDINGRIVHAVRFDSWQDNCSIHVSVIAPWPVTP